MLILTNFKIDIRIVRVLSASYFRKAPNSYKRVDPKGVDLLVPDVQAPADYALAAYSGALTTLDFVLAILDATVTAFRFFHASFIAKLSAFFCAAVFVLTLALTGASLFVTVVGCPDWTLFAAQYFFIRSE